MRKIRLGLVVSFLAMSLCVIAQSADQIKKQINSVKKSNQYIYAEVTCSTAEEAKSLVEDMLYTEVNEWVAGKKRMKGKAIVLADRKDLVTVLSLPRGNMFRAFSYVKKTDIIPTENAQVMTNASQENTSTAQPVWPETVTNLATYTDYYEMADKLKEMKSAGKIKTYARYQKLKNPESYYLVIYNREGKVLGILSPGVNRTNVATGLPDDLKNYDGSDCGAIGFITN